MIFEEDFVCIQKANMKTNMKGSRRTQNGKRAKNNRQKAGQGALVTWDPTRTYTDKLSMPRFPGSVYDVIMSGESLSALASSTTLAVFAAISFTASAFANFASLAAGFDQYRIRMLEVILTPRTNMNVSQTITTGLFTSVIDYDDAAAPTTIAQLLEYDNAITTQGTITHRRCFKPRIATAVYSGAFTSFANTSGDQWIDVASNTVQYYGVKLGWTVTTQSAVYDEVYRAHFQFRCGR